MEWTQNIENIPNRIRDYYNFIPVAENKAPTSKNWTNEDNWAACDDIEGKRGFVLYDTPFLVLDFDHLRESKTAKMKDGVKEKYWGIRKEIQQRAGGATYTEYSCSGCGLHMIFELNPLDYPNMVLTGGEHGTIPLVSMEEYRKDPKQPKLELYYGCKHQFIFTGNLYAGIQPKQGIISGEAAADVFLFLQSLLEEPGTIAEDAATVNPVTGKERENLLYALNCIDPDCEYGTWIQIGKACKNAGLTLEDWDRWSKRGKKYTAAGDYSCDTKWKTFKVNTKSWNAGTIVRLAKESGNYSKQEEVKPEGPNVVYDSESKSFKVAKEIPKPIPRTAAELEEKDIPPIQWIVVDTLPTGLSVVAAPPKSYKSYFALGLCTKVTRGEDFFGHKTVKAGCLYFDLESSDRRPRDRLRQILGDGPKPGNLYFLTGEDDIRRIGEGFEEQLNSLLDAYTDIKLVVIDVFQLIKPAKKRGMDSYEADYAALGALNYIAKKRDICIMLIHHTKKGKDPSDIFNNMSGSTAMAGAMDTIFIISRENRTDDDAILTVSGRDVKPEELAIRWDAKRFRWSCLGTQEDVAWNKLKKDYDNSNIVKTVKHLLKENDGKWAGSASDIDTAARFTTHHINESPEKIAKDIDRFEELFMLDNIQFRKDRTGNKRFYEFTLS